MMTQWVSLTCYLLMPSGSTLRSLSWGLLALSFSALLVGLFALRSSVQLLNMFALHLTSNNFPKNPVSDMKNSPTTGSGSGLSLPSPESSIGMALRLTRGITDSRLVMMGVLWMVLAAASVWTEVRGSNIYEFHNVQVQKINDWSFNMKPALQPEFYVPVCRDYLKPQFDTGMTLSRVIFVDEGHCWSLNPNKHAGYYIKH
jgi:hypothetical protein